MRFLFLLLLNMSSTDYVEYQIHRDAIYLPYRSLCIIKTIHKGISGLNIVTFPAFSLLISSFPSLLLSFLLPFSFLSLVLSFLLSIFTSFHFLKIFVYFFYSWFPILLLPFFFHSFFTLPLFFQFFLSFSLTLCFFSPPIICTTFLPLLLSFHLLSSSLPSFFHSFTFVFPHSFSLLPSSSSSSFTCLSLTFFQQLAFSFLSSVLSFLCSIFTSFLFYILVHFFTAVFFPSFTYLSFLSPFILFLPSLSFIPFSFSYCCPLLVFPSVFRTLASSFVFISLLSPSL